MVVEIKNLMLTFDIEEFDIAIPTNFEISKNGAKNLLKFVKENKIKPTFFITAVFAKRYPKLIKELSKVGEIGLHGYSHSDKYNQMDEQETYKRLKKGKQILEKISNQKVKGFRAPRLQISDNTYKVLKELNFEYDSSFHPTIVLGHYNNFFGQRTPFVKNGIIVIPLSVTPILKLPFSWFWFKNLNLTYVKFCTKRALSNQDFINLYFHSWEFSNLENLKISSLIKKNFRVDRKLKKYLDWCREELKLKTITLSEFSSKIF